MNSNHAGDTIGISHTRWATHGGMLYTFDDFAPVHLILIPRMCRCAIDLLYSGKTDENAHPHSDHKDRLALVHNGTIENSSALKAELEAKGIPFRSQTDTEVIVQLIGTYLDEKVCPVLISSAVIRAY